MQNRLIYQNLIALEQSHAELVSRITPDGTFIFDETTTQYEFVSLANAVGLPDDEQKAYKPHTLRKVVFKILQPNLRYLDVSYCNLEELHIENCPNLQILYANNNQLNFVRFTGTFVKLEFVNLDRNQLTVMGLNAEFAPNLKYLYLYENALIDLSHLADFFAKDENDFNLEKNENLSAPPKDLAKNKNDVREWAKQAKKYTVEKAYEAKILIVGEPNAGKTTLMELLFDRNFKVPQPAQKSTLGIEIKQNREFENTDSSLPKIKAHVWDFGGQDIQYMLHQYFLTDDSVYILITDGRSGKTRYSYWFHIINLLAKKSPVLVLLNRNKASDTVIPFDERTYSDIFPELKIVNCGEIDFANLKKNWDAFEERIAENLAKLPIVGKPVIQPWKKVREEIDKIRQRKYIPLSEFEEICVRAKLEEPQEIEFLLQYFHKIGIALNFDDITLQNWVFLDPNWITRAIYDVLSDNLVIDKNGEFEQNKLFNHWLSKTCDDKHTQPYTKTECNFLLNLMLKDKFDICYNLPHKPNHFVVPMKLPDKRPGYNLGEGKTLHFRFQYSFMPEGLISRLIVRLHNNIYKGNVWLSGTVFADKFCKAEVIQQETTNEGLKYIGIKVIGEVSENRRSLLRTIRNEIEYIHENNFPYVNYSEMIVCNCAVCEQRTEPNYYESDLISSSLEAGEITVFCKHGKQKVEIEKLIHEVFAEDEIDKSGRRTKKERIIKTKVKQQPMEPENTLKFNNTGNEKPINPLLWFGVMAATVVGGWYIQMPWAYIVLILVGFIIVYPILEAFNRLGSKISEKTLLEVLKYSYSKIPGLSFFINKSDK